MKAADMIRSIALFYLVGQALFVTDVAAQSKRPIASQDDISQIACGPCSLYNWLSHGNEELQGVLSSIAESSRESPVDTVKRIIETYGSRRSWTRPNVSRYGRHNGGIGSVNLMITAREILQEHAESEIQLEGLYLHRLRDESTEDHFNRITRDFTRSIEAGIPVLLYIRGYDLVTAQRNPRLHFGHHIVVTSIELVEDTETCFEFTYVDPAGGQVKVAYLHVAPQEFTAPTFTYRLTDRSAEQSQRLKTGRPYLQITGSPEAQPQRSGTRIIVPHFATFADVSE